MMAHCRGGKFENIQLDRLQSQSQNDNPLRIFSKERLKTEQQQFLQPSTSKAHKIKELEIEIAEYQLECKRLRVMLKSRRKADYKIEDKDGIINDNIKLSKLVAELEDETLLQKDSIKLLEQINKRLIFKYNLSKNQQEKLNIELQVIRNQLIPAINEGQIRVHNSKLKKELSEKEDQNSKLMSELKEWQKRYHQIEKQHEQLAHEYIALKTKKQKEKNNLKEKISLLEKENRLLEMQTVKNNDSDSSKSSQPFEKVDNDSGKRLRRVNKHDVKGIGRLIRLHLIEQNIPYEDIENFLLNEQQSISGQVTINHLIQSLQQLPFYLVNNEETTLLARYLIEDNQEEHVFFDLTRNQEVGIVKSIFKQLIGKFDLINQDEYKKMKVYFGVLLKKYKYQLLQGIKSQLKSSRLESEFCTCEELMQTFRMYEIEISQKQKDFLQIEISKKYPMERIKYEELFEQLQQLE